MPSTADPSKFSALGRKAAGLSPLPGQGSAGYQGVRSHVDRSGGGRFGGGSQGQMGLASSISSQFSPTPVAPEQSSPALGGGSSAPAPMPSPSGPPPVVPGVSGITPGAIERRVGGPPPSLGLGGGAPPSSPSQALRNFNPDFMRNKPNLTGPARGQMNAPVANIQQFLQNLRSQRGPQ